MWRGRPPSVGLAIIAADILCCGTSLSLRNLGLWWAWWLWFGRIRPMSPVLCSSSARVLRGLFR